MSTNGNNGGSNGPNAGTADPTDGKKKYQWKSEYPYAAQIQIGIECAYLFALLLFAYYSVFHLWQGDFFGSLNVSPASQPTFKKFGYYFFSGMLGGVVFGIKYLYRVVARGYWHQERLPWRLLAPWISCTVAFVIGAMIDSTLISTQAVGSPKAAYIVSIGFVAGYFADEAVGKMYDVATVVFGRNAKQNG